METFPDRLKVNRMFKNILECFRNIQRVFYNVLEPTRIFLKYIYLIPILIVTNAFYNFQYYIPK